ncbi:acetoacetate decarboxylase family protein [Amycolatopsis sp. FDAARGOS 1241]|uniref:acetoacetate decarboxylase family protein n=1 Tax=Amycolatopsis sp. FDAARGOS 1241 TaxID=2778070 RepID=UPI00194E36DE|nr:acetoacetate decarboxylase family protein [Amycolatopsis sp. FDAARGOS 1241]QRP43731.1 acetoacetate decarboxylase family protein [Amycolatopsis sp. FDAARGOS 1241]
MTDYPPEPWHLAGQAHLSVWLLPVARLPKLPEGAEPLVAGGHAPVCTAWFDYRAPGQLTYHELLCATAIRGGLAASITDIWVDSASSRAGGRELWGIPKDLATLDFTGDRTFTAAAATAGGWIATAAFTRRAGLPAALPTRFEIAQALGGRLKRSPVSSRAKLHAAAADWSINPSGPLGFLAGRRPIVSAQLRDFKLVFGAEPTPSRRSE